MKKCPKCNKEHEKSGKFCSRSCANSRGPRSNDFKNKVSKKLKKPRLQLTCKNCGKIFKQKRSNWINKFCSSECNLKFFNKLRKLNGLSSSHKEKLSLIRKKLFKEGKIQVSGGNTSWIKYKNIKVQGSYELRTCFILDKWKENNSILDWEYTNDRITYTNIQGDEATYLLDFKIKTLNNKDVYIETKGFIRENDELKWEACKNFNINLKIWFEEDIIKYENIVDVADVVLALS